MIWGDKRIRGLTEFQMFSEGPGMTHDGELKSGVLV